jgi:hypothetical protein
MDRCLRSIGCLFAALTLVTACASSPAPEPKPVPSAPPTGFVPTLGAPVKPGMLPTTDVVFIVQTDADHGLWTISPEIYGVNTPAPGASVDSSMRAGSMRFGGNRTSAYNWENNASNAGNDYHNQSDGYLSSSNTPGALASQTFNQASAMGAQTSAVITVPIGDYVAADKSPGGDVATPPSGVDGGGVDGGYDYLSARFKKNVAAKGTAFSDTPDTSDDSVYEDEMVAWAKGHNQGTPVAFALDNEPDLWSETHPRIHPNATTYDELVERTTRFSTAIKNVWPEAPILGFVSYGWNGFTKLQSAPDAAGKGEFWDYFLTQMKAAGDAQGRRLVDYLDLHWYPEAKGAGFRIVTAPTAPTAAADIAAWEDARVQAPRSLWDPTYRESSWITSSVGGPIALIPRVMGKIQADYPGTKLAFTEWNYGGGSDITGAIATADVLGIFGRTGVSLANIWWVSAAEPFTVAGVKAYRNFDGQAGEFGDGEFGDIGIATSNSDTESTSVYASLLSTNPGHVVVVAINKKKDATINAGIQLAHPASFSKAKVYVLSGTSPSIQPAQDLGTIGSNAFVYAMPPRSVSILVFDGTLAATSWSPGTSAIPPAGTGLAVTDAAVKADVAITADARNVADTQPPVDAGIPVDAAAIVDVESDGSSTPVEVGSGG